MHFIELHFETSGSAGKIRCNIAHIIKYGDHSQGGGFVTLPGGSNLTDYRVRESASEIDMLIEQIGGDILALKQRRL